MDKRKLKRGEIVQLVPGATRHEAFAGCLMVITESKAFGARGYVQALGVTRDSNGGQAYYRARWDEMEETGGVAPWIVMSNAEDE